MDVGFPPWWWFTTTFTTKQRGRHRGPPAASASATWRTRDAPVVPRGFVRLVPMAPVPPPRGVHVRFVLPLRPPPHTHVALLGNHEHLGGWDPTRAIPMVREKGDVWCGTVELPRSGNMAYKYVLMAKGDQQGQVVQWQPGNDLVLAMEQEVEQTCPEHRKEEPNCLEDITLQVVDAWEPCSRRTVPTWDPYQRGTDATDQRSNQAPTSNNNADECRAKNDGAQKDTAAPGEPSKVEGQKEQGASADHEVRRTLLVDCGMWQTRCAVIEEGNLVQLLAEREDQESIAVGDVLLGVVKSYVPVMKAYLVDIGTEKFALMDVGLHKAKRNMRVVLTEQQLQYNDEDSSVEETDEEEEEDIDDGEDQNGVYTMSFSEEVLSGSEANDLECLENELSEDDDVEEDILDDDDNISASVSQEVGDLFVPGDALIVQVTRMPSGRKGHKVTGTVSLSGKLTVLTPQTLRVGVSRKIKGIERSRLSYIATEYQPPNCGVIVRTEAEDRLEEELKEDIKSLYASWTMVLQKAHSRCNNSKHAVKPKRLLKGASLIETVVKDMFGRKVDELVVNSKAEYMALKSGLQTAGYKELSNRVHHFKKKNALLFDEYGIGEETEFSHFTAECLPLEGGGNIIIQATDALTTIDVNGGRAVFNQDLKSEEAVLGVNIAAADKIGHELRLRDIGGIIVVDFIDMKMKKHRKQVEDEVMKWAALDGADYKIGGISDFGLLEITRARRMPHLSAYHNMTCKCPSCEGSRYVQTPIVALQAIEREVKRWKISASKEKEGHKDTNTSRPQFKLITGGMLGKYLRLHRRQLNRLESKEKVQLKTSIDPFMQEGSFRIMDSSNQARTAATGQRAASKRK